VRRLPDGPIRPAFRGQFHGSAIVRAGPAAGWRFAIAAIGANRPTPGPAGNAAQADVSESLRLLPTGFQDHTMSSDLIQHTSDAGFAGDVLECDKPVLVDYWAEWCGPCKMIAPILDEVSKDYDGRLKVAKMNVDENRDVPAKYGIRGIPTLMLFKGGELAATKVGALSKAQLTAFIDLHL
jgi:thioredoxin 1